MDSVVATVSGYQGSERFNLIKLIDRAGANYVGNMSQSVTHLVCWKFEGKKYELAKKFRIPIVNHCWIEECLKQGRRVLEEPYTYSSGEEMGPLASDFLLGINQAKAQSKDLKIATRSLVDTEFEDIIDGNSIRLDEDLFPKKRQKDHGSSRSKGKAIKSYSRKDCPSSSRRGHKLPTTKTAELEEASTSRPTYSCRLGKRNSTSPESWSKGRRLVKKCASLKDWLILSDVEEECEEVEVLPENESRRVLVDSSEDEVLPENESRRVLVDNSEDEILPENESRRVLVDSSEDERQRFTNRNTSDMSTLNGLKSTDAYDTVQDIEHLNGNEIEDLESANQENPNSHACITPFSCATPEKLHEAANQSSTEEDSLLPASSELSCVICWTDFSSTRGVLACGHRFCFPCIQNWADHMNSSRKTSTCPLCKASFMCITKVEDAASSDQKIYSQSMPKDSSKMNLYVLPDETYNPPANVSASQAICNLCLGREPAELLASCHFCTTQWVHSFCLDPPLFPWTCVHCQDLQFLYRRNR
ncbi:glutathione peroxidase [Salvia divinorum]|uniref:Glutathione peroxidase n=1 Tax=Salvia divinorum TaxID=28513 RepID=A0ABD1G4R5_SALDI